MRTDGLLTIKPIKSDLIPPIDPKTGEPGRPDWRGVPGRAR